MVLSEKIKIPQVKITCCGITYNTSDPKTSVFFRGFFHKNINEYSAAKICLTIWLTCKNNGCIHARTFYYDDKGKLIGQTTARKMDYILKLQNSFIENAEIKPKRAKIYDMSNKYLWKYAKSLNGKTQNIYDFNNIKTGENYKPITLKSVLKNSP